MVRKYNKLYTHEFYLLLGNNFWIHLCVDKFGASKVSVVDEM